MPLVFSFVFSIALAILVFFLAPFYIYLSRLFIFNDFNNVIIIIILLFIYLFFFF